ncbi:MAG: hypothetical protein JWM24_236 [Solirubrobacterales bacterium]|nr:hypothetical protein [Solirubrobacterales bacterium]
MSDQMPPWRGQRLSRLVKRPSFAGRSLVERMRTTAFALLGVTTAMALGLVALVSHQSWPYLPVGPVPSYQPEHGRIDSAIALTPAVVELGISPAEPPAHSVLAGDGPGVTAPNQSRLSGSHRVTSHSAASDPAPGQPGAAGAPSPTPGAVPTSPAAQSAPSAPVATPISAPPAAPTPAPTTPSPSPAPVVAANPGKGHAYGKEKASAAPKPKPPHPAPTSTPIVPAAVPAPPPVPVAASAPGSSDDPGNGHGHAYGHDE